MKILLFLFMLLLAMTVTACDSDSQQIDEPDTEQPDNSGNNNNSENTSLMINIIVGNSTITATMEDNVAARDFLSRLPLEVTLNDYANTEKIFYSSPALSISGAPRGCTPAPGDITIYAPWGNVAIFYKSFSSSNDLIKIGRIDGSGINVLSIAGDVQVKFELKPE